MLTRRRLLQLVGKAALAGALAGCGRSLPTAAPSGETQAPQTAESSATPEPTQPPELHGTILVAVSGGSFKAWQALADAYVAKHPKVEVIIELQNKPLAERDAYYRKQFASGQPDMSLATINTLVELDALQSFMNWQPYLNAYSPYTNKPWQEGLFPEVVNPLSEHPDSQYMLSTELYQVLFYYNADLASKQGLDPDSPPTTYNELVEWAHSVREGFVGIDLQEISDQVDWLTRAYADPWYATPDFWSLCRCQPEDACFVAREQAFPAEDWRTNPHYDDPNRVDMNLVRAWEAFDQGHFMGALDSSFEPMMLRLRELLEPATLPIDWRLNVRTQPLWFYTGQALLHPAGSPFPAVFNQAMQQLPSGHIGLWPQGRQTPTPDPAITRGNRFELGAFALPPQDNGSGQLAYQRTLEQPVGYWGIPRKIQQQNDLEVDFVMFLTSPEGTALRLASELDPENAEGNLFGLPMVKDVQFPSQWARVFANLKPQGTILKPTPVHMVLGGVPSAADQRFIALADFFEGTSDAATLMSTLRARRELDRDAERAGEEQ
ncbi:MAG: carbohydrate ABC transporter substrate-binding protein [Chloroflexi bacterium]|nr:carbohydrate ABC transporter substrate-binding protein [Chloroflexota bacterium]